MTKVKEMMTLHPQMIDPGKTLRQAARKMRKHECGALIVGRDIPKGIITDRDIVIFGLAAEHDPDITMVGDIMTADLVCCCEDDTIEEAAETMGDLDLRRLVVLDAKGAAVGILSVSDIIKQVDRDAVNDEVIHHLFKYA